MPSFTFLIASARDNGNSEQLARIAAEAFDDSNQTWLALREYPLPFKTFATINTATKRLLEMS